MHFYSGVGMTLGGHLGCNFFFYLIVGFTVCIDFNRRLRSPGSAVRFFDIELYLMSAGGIGFK